MEPEDKQEAETAPVDLSFEVENKEEDEPKPMEASMEQRDEKEVSTTPFNASGDSVSVAQEDQGNPKGPADAMIQESNASGESVSVAQEDRGNPKVPADAMVQESKDKEDAGGDIKFLSADVEENVVEKISKPSTLSHSVEKEINDSETCSETSNKLTTAKNKTAGSLKVRPMITKKFPVSNSIKKKAGRGDLKALRSTNDGVSKDEQDIKVSPSDVKNLPGNSTEVEVKAIEEEGPAAGDKENQSNIVVEEFHESTESKNKQKFGPASKNKKRKLEGREKLQSSEKAEDSEKKGEANDTEENRKENGNKKGKLGGLIFMCSSKTKPDCIKYRVMGVNMGKKDLVMAIQPGLKLFLYDYDLKLMYGIFKASSLGGIKLEPRAFNGAFPVQVRFNIQVECHPLPEVVFKKAMLANFTSKHKFRTELSYKQVRKLSKLFQPVALGLDHLPQSEEVPDRPSQKIRTQEENSQARERALGHQPRSKRSRRDSYGDREARRHKVRVYGRGHRDLSTLRRVDTSHETVLLERESRAYGLPGERRNLTIIANVDPGLPSREVYYEGDHLARGADEVWRGLPSREVYYEGDHLARGADEVRRDVVPGHRHYVLASHRYLDDIDYRSYSLDVRPELSPAAAGRSISSAHHFHPEDQYITYRHGPASLVPYAEHLRREDIPSSLLQGYDRGQAYGYETDDVRRMEDVPTSSRSGIYTANALAEYDQVIRYGIPLADATHMPVSSWYSFAGRRI